jgi:hypothetical protein
MSGLRCPKCEGVMEAGYVLDHTQPKLYAASSWVEGPPEKSIWSGLHTKNRRNLPVIAYRCVACGYLELYAPGERKKKS